MHNAIVMISDSGKYVMKKVWKYMHGAKNSDKISLFFRLSQCILTAYESVLFNHTESTMPFEGEP